MSSIYEDGSYYATNPTLDADHGPFKARETLKVLRRHGIAPHTICEIGCGAGTVIAGVARAYPEAIAEGFRLVYQNDHELLERESSVYDALYAYCQQIEQSRSGGVKN